MNKQYDKWLEYYKKENETLTGSLKYYYKKLKELHRDKVIIYESVGGLGGSFFDAGKKEDLLHYIETNISLIEKKVDKFIEDELPNFHD